MSGNSNFQVIITTYNRKENIVRLVEGINLCHKKPESIIVVDTTDTENEALKKIENVYYIRSNQKHQNQPYKRLVGALIADTENIIFMDDDLEILDNNIFEKILPLFAEKNIAGFTAAIDFQNQDAEKGFSSTTIGKILLFFTGRPIVRSGKIGLAGHVGLIKGSETTNTEFLHGPIMGFKREVFLKLPDEEMLTIFDRQLAIPEDKILSIRAKKYGELLYYPERLVRHPVIKSTYFLNVEDHTARVHFSRYLINRELCKARGNGKNYWYDFHFYYYSFWRKLVSAIGVLVKPGYYRQKLKGLIIGEKWVKQIKNGQIPFTGSILDDAKTDSLTCLKR